MNSEFDKSTSRIHFNYIGTHNLKTHYLQSKQYYENVKKKKRVK